ncbi:shikimate dehydrogenase [Maricaulis parjimensis]|uniref:shikimate dehydrogenase n=1 Tax=Maricaulis parjimensis TaxID=144023 RepID=UPI003B838823
MTPPEQGSDGPSNAPIWLGLVGRGILGSGSPAMHHEEGLAQQLEVSYRLFDFDAFPLEDDKLRDIIRSAQMLRLNGLNITHPFKQTVMASLDAIDADAALVGAVNTVVFQYGRAIGYNTDFYGFRENLSRHLPEKRPGPIVQIGAGGAGAACAAAALDLGCPSLGLYDSDPLRSAALAARLTDRFPNAQIEALEEIEPALAKAAGLVNTSPIGMSGHPGTPVAATLLRPELWVADIVYFPRETELLKQASERGCLTIDGGGMAVLQAAAAFDLFTRRTADRDRMMAEFDRRRPL